MMNNRFVLYYIMIPLGICIALLNSVILFTHSRIQTFDLFISAMLAVQLLLSLVIIFLDLFGQKKAFPLYIGLLMLFWGLLSIIVYVNPDYGISQFWPLFVILSGILLIVSGCYKYKKLKFGFVIPSVTLIGMGLWYMLFSFKIIKLSFVTVAAVLGPVFMLVIAGSLILFFLAQQKHKQLIINDDDTGTFADEDVPLNRLGD